MTQASRLRTPLFIAAIAVILAAAAGTTARTAAIKNTASLGTPTTLSKDVPELAQMQETGALPASQRVTVALQVADPYRAAEESLYGRLYRPGDPLYRRFLTPAQFAAEFGAPASQKDQVRNWLTGGGLQVSYSAGTGRYWVARGAAGDVERLFNVELKSYHVMGETAYANASAPTVPSGLGIEHVFLTDGLRAQTQQSVPFPALAANPSDLWNLYNAPANDTGQGEQLGILGFLYNPGDASLGAALKDFETVNKIPQVPLRVIPTEAAAFGATSTGEEGEWELDTQASSGMAPGVTDVDFYDAPAANLSDGTASIAYWAADPNGPRQASASWGACEDNPAFHAIGANYAEAMTAAELQAIDEGRTLFASTGDTGSGCVTPANLAPVNLNGVYESPNSLQTMPAALPWTVAVGGTVLYPDSSDSTKRGLEYSWTHGGGGASRFVAEPDYQKNDANVIIPCVSDDGGGTGNTGVTCRGVPDVSIISGDIFTDGFNIQDRSGGCTPSTPGTSCTLTVLGTSLSSPLWLGTWARIQAAAPSNLGFANPSLYKIGTAADQTQYQRDFNDIIIGTNGLYHAAPGWDYTSGWGTPQITNLAQDVTGSTSLNPTHPGSTPPPLPPPPGGGGTGGGGGSGLPPPSDAACTPLWTDASGDDTFVGNQTGVAATAVDQGQDPQLDLVTSKFLLSADMKTLRAQLVINDLSKTIPAYSQANVYFAIFSISGIEYYGAAEVDPSGSVTYTYGTISSAGIGSVGPVTGAFGSGKNGIVEIDLPLKDIGANGAQLGQSLTNTGGETWALTGVNTDNANTLGQPSFAGQGLYSPIDNSPQDSNSNFVGRTFVVGEECTPPAGKLALKPTAEGQSFTGGVATFTDKRTADQASEFAATIDWGDGTTSAGTVTGGNGSFTVSGAHSWSDEGPMSVSVSLEQVDDPHRPAGVASSIVAVPDADILACKMPSRLYGSANFSGFLGSCTDTDTTTPAGGLIAKIDWGDGSIVNYVAVIGGSGSFKVIGRHVYSRTGRYLVHIALSDPGGAMSAPVSTWLVVR
ncbi:MAG TPA: S53 family peptidase [Candidatus Dormibacteraeota bacterium]